MQRFRKVHLMVILVALMVAVSGLMGGTVRANVVDCSLAPFFGTIAGVVDGDVLVPFGTRCTIRGTVNGNIDATAGGAFVAEPEISFDQQVRVRGGTVNGNIEGGPGSDVVVGSTVNGNIEVTGTVAAPSRIQLFGGAGASPSTSVVNGDVIHNGTGVVAEFFSPNLGVLLAGTGGFGVRVEGNIKAHNGAGVVNSFFSVAPHTVTGNIECNGVAGDDVLLLAANMNVQGNLENCG